MDITSVSALPTPLPSRVSAGGAGSVPPITAISNPASPQANTSALSSPATATASHDSTTQDSLAQALKQVNDSFTQKKQNLYASFEKDKATGINVVKIIDQKTNETISQMPAKETVALAQFLQNPQGMRGKLIHATA